MGNCLRQECNYIKTIKINLKDNLDNVNSSDNRVLPNSLTDNLEFVQFLKIENIEDVYYFTKKLGQGFHATVNLGFKKEDPIKPYAIKTMKITKLNKRKEIMREVDILSKLDHPNLVEYYETLRDDNKFYIVMEYLQGGELLHRISSESQTMPEPHAAEILFKLTSAVRYCHSKGIVHRDLKLENVLFETKSDHKSDVKIIDFSLGTTKGLFNLTSFVGTPYYVAPEVLEGNYDSKCDVWGLGVIMYTLLVGKFPFMSANKKKLFLDIKTQKLNFTGINISQDAIKMLNSMLNKNPELRPSAEDLMEFDWFKRNLRDLQLDMKQIPDLRITRAPCMLLRLVLKMIVRELDPDYFEKIKETIIFGYNSSLVSSLLGNSNTMLKTKLTNDTTHEPPAINLDYSLYVVSNCKDLITPEVLRVVFSRLVGCNEDKLTVKGIHNTLRKMGKWYSEKEVQKFIHEFCGYEQIELTYEQFVKKVTDFIS